MADIAIFRINYKSDFVLDIHSDAGWSIPFCIKFWTGAPTIAYFVGFDGTEYRNCRLGDTPDSLVVLFDDHHLPVGDLTMQMAYHTTIEEFPSVEFDEVTNPEYVVTNIDGQEYHVMLDFTGEMAPEIQFSLPAYANEAQRIANEQDRERIFAEMQQAFATMQQESEQATAGAEKVDAELNGTILTVTNRRGETVSQDVRGPQGEQGHAGSDADVTAENIERALGFTPQQQLVSGQNIKTINNESLLGSGNINVQGGSGEVISVNGKKGVVVLNSEDVGAASQSEVTAIEELIPQQATSQNQLADKNFVNSSISTNTAYYISNNGEPFTSLAQLEAYIGTLTNNDYAFVVGTDAAGNTTYTRYKYNADTQQWAAEYVLNNSSFTAEQWAAIQSGITAALVGKLSDLPTNTELTALLGTKPNTSSLAAVAFSGSYNDLSDKLTVMGASGSGHKGGLVPDTPSSAGNTKFLREDGTWAEPAAGGGTSYVPTLNAAPTSSTTTYTKDGQTLPFEIGQFCRVPKTGGGYDFYQLYDLVTESNVTTATWKDVDELPSNVAYISSDSGVGIVPEDGIRAETVTSAAAMSINPDVVTVINGAVGTAAITLQVPNDNLAHVWDILMTTDSTVAITFAMSNSATILYPNGFSVGAGKAIEISVIGVGTKYYLRYGEFA